MSRNHLAQACAAAALLCVSPAALAQNTTGNTTAGATDPALGTTTADPLATNTTAGTTGTTGTTTGTDPGGTTTVDPMATTTTDPAMTTTDPMMNDPMMGNTTEPQDEDNDFPWGLLGLLGLAGLLGMKRKDDGDVHVDARRDTR